MLTIFFLYLAELSALGCTHNTPVFAEKFSDPATYVETTEVKVIVAESRPSDTPLVAKGLPIITSSSMVELSQLLPVSSDAHFTDTSTELSRGAPSRDDSRMITPGIILGATCQSTVGISGSFVSLIDAELSSNKFGEGLESQLASTEILGPSMDSDQFVEAFNHIYGQWLRDFAKTLGREIDPTIIFYPNVEERVGKRMSARNTKKIFSEFHSPNTDIVFRAEKKLSDLIVVKNVGEGFHVLKATDGGYFICDLLNGHEINCRPPREGEGFTFVTSLSGQIILGELDKGGHVQIANHALPLPIVLYAGELKFGTAIESTPLTFEFVNNSSGSFRCNYSTQFDQTGFNFKILNRTKY